MGAVRCEDRGTRDRARGPRVSNGGTWKSRPKNGSAARYGRTRVRKPIPKARRLFQVKSPSPTSSGCPPAKRTNGGQPTDEGPASMAALGLRMVLRLAVFATK